MNICFLNFDASGHIYLQDSQIVLSGAGHNVLAASLPVDQKTGRVTSLDPLSSAEEVVYVLYRAAFLSEDVVKILRFIGGGIAIAVDSTMRLNDIREWFIEARSADVRADYLTLPNVRRELTATIERLIAEK